jgi:hypothetical protein
MGGVEEEFKAVERVAKALFDDCKDHSRQFWSSAREATKRKWRKRAKAAIAAMQSYGSELTTESPEGEVCQFGRNLGSPAHATLAEDDTCRKGVGASEGLKTSSAPDYEDAAFPLGAIENGRGFISRLESNYRFEDSERPLSSNAEWDELKRCFEYMAEYLLSRAVLVSLEKCP